MKMTSDHDDKMLDQLFAQARERDAAPSDALMARITADAVASVPTPSRAPARRGGFIAAFVGVLGGWTAVSGLAAATVAGIWIGFAPPQSLESIAGNLLGSSDVAVPFLELSDPFGLEG